MRMQKFKAFLEKAEPLPFWVLMVVALGTTLKLISVIFQEPLSWRTLILMSIFFGALATLCVELTRWTSHFLKQMEDDDDDYYSD